MKLLDIKSLVIAASFALTSMSSQAALVVSGDINPAADAEHYNFDYSSLPGAFSDYILLTFTGPRDVEATVSGTSAGKIDFDNFDILSFDKSTTLASGDLSNPTVRAALGFVADSTSGGQYWLYIAGTSTGAASYLGTISAISPVPEPQAYGMMLAGLGLIGFIARRRLS